MGRIPGVQGRRPADAAHHHGTSARRAGAVAGSVEGGPELQHLLDLVDAGLFRGGVLGGAADLAGKAAPKTLNLPLPVIQKQDIEKWLAVMPEGSVAVSPYNLAWTVEMIDANVAGKPLPASPAAKAGDM